jgi:energy-coupling factor transporter ATP-binding protein EcfA2
METTYQSRTFNRPDELPEQSEEQWYQSFKEEWHEGEHVALIGPTGTGKTTIAHRILDIRTNVCVLAIKREDDTLERFKDGHKYGRDRYKVISKWPPDYPYRKVIYWKKPKSLHADDVREQAKAVYHALNKMYLAGDWCVYLDEAGYIAGVLGLSSAFGILLNQGRSARISVVAAMTRPSSLVARIPRESFTQVRHHIVFKYTDEREIKSCAEIAGIGNRDMQAFQRALQVDSKKGYSDFLYIGKGKVILIKNTGA